MLRHPNVTRNFVKRIELSRVFKLLLPDDDEKVDDENDE